MKYFVLTFMLLLSFAGMAQQMPFFGFYRDVASFYNPATVGLENAFKANLLFRNQWEGFLGSPHTFMGQVESKLENINSGIGLNVMHEYVGFAKYTAITGNYNYQWSLSDKSNKISIGVAPKFYAMEFPNLLVDTMGVGTPSYWNRSNAFTMNVGAAFQTEKLYVGLGAMNVIPTEQQLNDDFNFNHALHLSLMASYDIQLFENMKVIPNVHVLSDINFITAYINIRAEHKKLWYQIGTYNGHICASVGYRIMDRINIGYQIEYYSPKIITWPNPWTHEAFIAYELN